MTTDHVTRCMEAAGLPPYAPQPHELPSGHVEGFTFYVDWEIGGKLHYSGGIKLTPERLKNPHLVAREVWELRRDCIRGLRELSDNEMAQQIAADLAHRQKGQDLPLLVAAAEREE